MEINSEKGVLGVDISQSQTDDQKKLNLTYLCLCAFALFRPVLTIKYFADIGVGGLNLYELFSILISYVLMLATLFGAFKSKKFHIDFVNIFALLFCLYLLSTVAIGSQIRDTSRLFLPVLVFFAVRTLITDKDQIKTLLLLSIISYIIPLIGSASLIMLGKSVGKTIYQTGLIRYEGLYERIHTLAHCMYIFIFIFIYYSIICKEQLKEKRFFKYFLYFLLICALFSLFKSYTRNVWIGLLILMTFFLIGRKNYVIMGGLLVGAIIVMIMSEQAQTYFFDIIEPLKGEREIRHLGAGRFGMWTKIIRDFKALPLEMKLIGVGVGKTHGGFEIARGHNDFISLLYTSGIMGLCIYLILLFIMAIDMVRSSINRSQKFLYLGFLTAVVFMNMASNSYLSRIEIGQFFFFIIGTFYVTKNYAKEDSRSTNHRQT